MKRDFKIRFNLSRGNHYKHWKLEYCGHIEYYDPRNTTLIMHDCKLHNNRKTADKIHAGEHKTVCAWIRCAGLVIFHDEPAYYSSGVQISYNPRKQPYWSSNDSNIDNKELNVIYSNGNKLFTA